MRSARFIIGGLLALACAHCSLLLYNEDDLVGPSTQDAGDATVADGSPRDDGSTVESGSGDGGATDASTDQRNAAVPDGATVWSMNGHAYLVVIKTKDITWEDARAEASLMGGHLVSVTSAEENLFVFQLALGIDGAWRDNGGILNGPWIGAYQPDGSVEPGGFSWVTGEPFTYTSWRQGEPSNGGADENYVHYFGSAQKTSTWNDIENAGPIHAFVVEFE